MTCVAVRNKAEDRTELISLKDILFFQAADSCISIHEGRNKAQPSQDHGCFDACFAA